MALNKSLTHKPDWYDLLEPRRSSSDIFWVTFHHWRSQCYRTVEKDHQHVNHHFLEHDLIKILLETPENREKIVAILNEMGHDWSMKSVRLVGFFVLKIMKRIYRNLNIDMKIPESFANIVMPSSILSINRTMNSIACRCPVLYLPTHRSYADFILLSFVCFSLSLPLPVIAAGIDFLSLKFIAQLLRQCGAFFLRRSFRNSSDQLYSQVFRAYIETLILHGQKPVEVFIEGARSRSGKSLYPRTGLLSIATQLLIHSKIVDLVIIPISISYERTLEETLYAKELSPPIVEGATTGSKPAETTSHLMSGARAILSQDFGSIFIRFGEPMSLRELPETLKLRKAAVVRGNETVMSNEEEAFSLKLAIDTIRKHHHLTVLTSFPFISLIIISRINDLCGLCDYGKLDEGTFIEFDFDQLKSQIEGIEKIVPTENLARQSLNQTLSQDIVRSLKVNENLIEMCDEKIRLKTCDELQRTVVRHYSNQLLQIIFQKLIILSVDTFYKYRLVEFILSHEFIMDPINEQEFLEQRYLLFQILSTENKATLRTQFNFFLTNYREMTLWLLNCDQELSSSKDLTKLIQSELRLSLDLVQNFFRKMRAIKALNYGADGHIFVDSETLRKFLEKVRSISNHDQRSPPTVISNL